MTLHRIALALAVFAFSGNVAIAAYIPSLDGISQHSTFELGSVVDLPTAGWTNVSGEARVFDGDFNGAIIHKNLNRGNYEVQYTTATSIQPLSSYTLSLQMGYAGGASGQPPSAASADYRMQIGTVNGLNVFTPLGSKTGTVPYGQNITGSGSTWVPFDASLTVDTGSVVSDDVLAVRWAQTGRDTDGVSWFGFDNVRLEVQPVPEPASAALLLIPGLALLTRGHRRR